MDLFTAMKERRSCRNFLPEPMEEATMEKILEAATWAPSPLTVNLGNSLSSPTKKLKKKIFSEGEDSKVGS